MTNINIPINNEIVIVLSRDNMEERIVIKVIASAGRMTDIIK